MLFYCCFMSFVRTVCFKQCDGEIHCKNPSMKCIKEMTVSFAMSNSNLFFSLELQELVTRIQNKERGLYGETHTHFDI